MLSSLPWRENKIWLYASILAIPGVIRQPGYQCCGASAVESVIKILHGLTVLTLPAIAVFRDCSRPLTDFIFPKPACSSAFQAYFGEAFP